MLRDISTAILLSCESLHHKEVHSFITNKTYIAMCNVAIILGHSTSLLGVLIFFQPLTIILMDSEKRKHCYYYYDIQLELCTIHPRV